MTYAVTAVSQDPSDLTELYRSDLGLPYERRAAGSPRDARPALATTCPAACCRTSWADTTMGVDPGARFHYRVSSGRPPRPALRPRDGLGRTWDELDGLMDRWRVRLCVVDAMPELHAAQEFAARHEGRVLRAFYPQASAMSGQLFVVNEDKGVVQVNRTMAMDRVYANVAKGAEHWPAEIHNDREVIAHMKAPVRVLALDARGQEQATWVHTRV
jgi:hypothetical protein